MNGVLAFLLGFVLTPTPAADTNSSPAPPGIEDTNASLDTLRSYLELQAQLHAAQLAIERNRQENEVAAARNAEALTNALQLIEKSLDVQREREFQAVWWVLAAAGTLAVVGLLALLFTAFLQWRAAHRLTEMPMLPASALALWAGRSYPALGSGEMPLARADAAEQSTARLLGVIERLERRTVELEHAAHAPLSEHTSSSAEPKPPPTSAAGEVQAPHADKPKSDPVALMLAKGQSLLNQEEHDQALACFDEVLASEPNHPEALVKKGVALERLRKVDEAIRCYDDAIAADASMTIAYLYKGGLFNRLERYSEALACYEQALRTQENRRG